MSARRYRHISTSFQRSFLMQITDVILLCISNIISMDGKTMQLQRDSFDILLKDEKIVVVLVPLIDKFSIF